MTTEIVIMNKSAIALAADSAVTIPFIDQQGQKNKIFNSANKLFTLSKRAPVGFMVYGSATLMGIPWEILVKLFRSSLSDTKLNTLEEYVAAFFDFLSSNDIFNELGDAYLMQIATSVFQSIRKSVDESVREKVSAEHPLTEADIVNILNDIIMKQNTKMNAEAENSVISSEKRKDLATNYAEMISSFFPKYFENLPLSEEHKSKLIDMAINGAAIGPMEQSGIVFAGFGEKEIFPSCLDFDVRAIFDGNAIRYKKRQLQVNHLQNSLIVTFAQSDDVSTFMEGIGKPIGNFFSQALRLTLTKHFPEKLADAIIEKLKMPLENKKDIIDVAADMGKGAYTEIIKEINNIKKAKFVDPVVKATSFLNKEELATMAETLVNLVSFRKQVTLDAETVGGPIDVAIITKGDGFIWIKRKHYFDPSLNHQFFANYFFGGNKNDKRQKRR
jgi:hypothetical protein